MDNITHNNNKISNNYFIQEWENIYKLWEFFLEHKSKQSITCTKTSGTCDLGHIIYQTFSPTRLRKYEIYLIDLNSLYDRPNTLALKTFVQGLVQLFANKCYLWWRSYLFSAQSLSNEMIFSLYTSLFCSF